MSRAGLALLMALLTRDAAAGPREIPLKLPSGKVLTVEVMETPEDRARGVMFRESLAPDRGLLFVFDEPERAGFWMKNCRFPLDMVWLDGDKKVVHVTEKAPPCTADPCPTYGPPRPVLYLLEINGGQAREEKAAKGSVLEFELKAPVKRER